MKRSSVVAAIERHLSRFPHAKDTVWGIAGWCRTSSGVSPPLGLVEDVLAELLRQQRIGSSVLVDGTRVYHAR